MPSRESRIAREIANRLQYNGLVPPPGVAPAAVVAELSRMTYEAVYLVVLEVLEKARDVPREAREVEPRPFTEKRITMPNSDCDVVLAFPGGKELLIQARPSNADVGYNGSLDIILPDNQPVTNWEGDDMKAARSVRGQAHTRFAKQLVTELLGSLDEDPP